jgi:hypothetical protein
MPSRAAAGLSRDFVSQAQAALQLLKSALALLRSYGHRFQLAEGTSPRGLTYHLHIKPHTPSFLLNSCRIAYHLLRQRLHPFFFFHVRPASRLFFQLAMR